MRLLDAAEGAVKKVVQTLSRRKIAGSSDPDAKAELERRARINAESEARKAARARELLGDTAWIGPRPGWINRRR